MDSTTLARSLMARGVLPLAYLLGTVAILVATFILVRGRRPRTPARSVVALVLGLLGIGLTIPALALGIIARRAEPPPAPTPAATTAPGSVTLCVTDGDLPPIPAPPPAGCVLTIEWQLASDPESRGLLVTNGPFALGGDAQGHWWYHPPEAAEQHIQAFQESCPGCLIEDRR